MTWNPARGRGLEEIAREEDAERPNRLRQEQEKRKKTRNSYRLLSKWAKSARESNYFELSSEEHVFEDILTKADILSAEGGGWPREQLQDAGVLETLSADLQVQAKKLQQQDGRSPDDFVVGLCRAFQRGGVGGVDHGGPSEHSFDWARLGRQHGIHFSQPAVSFGTMLGPMSAEAPKGRLAVQRRRRGTDLAHGPSVTPEERTRRPEATKAEEQATRDDQERERETEARARCLFRAIRKARPGSGGVPLLPLIVDPGCFTRSVENIFALSFLVKDGRCQLNGAPPPPGASPLECMLVEPKNAPSEEDRSRGLHENTQFIMRLDFSDWLNLKDGVWHAGSGQAVPDSQRVSSVI